MSNNFSQIKLNDKFKYAKIFSLQMCYGPKVELLDSGVDEYQYCCVLFLFCKTSLKDAKIHLVRI